MYTHLKNEVASTVFNVLSKLQNKYYHYRNDTHFLEKIIKEGAKKANQRASQTLNSVYKAVGIFDRFK